MGFNCRENDLTTLPTRRLTSPTEQSKQFRRLRVSCMQPTTRSNQSRWTPVDNGEFDRMMRWETGKAELADPAETSRSLDRYGPRWDTPQLVANELPTALRQRAAGSLGGAAT